MKEIQLTQGKVALVDDEDFDWLNQYRWYYHKGGTKLTYARGRMHEGSNKLVLMHRAIMNPPDNMVIDHRDGNGLNNQRANLWICTNLENTRSSEERLGIIKKKKDKRTKRVDTYSDKAYNLVMDNSQDTPYLTLQELSEATGIRCGTLQRRAIRGILPGAIKLGRDWFYPRALVAQVGTFGRGRKLTRLSEAKTEGE